MEINPGFREKKFTKESWPPEYYEYRKRWNEAPKKFEVGPFPIHIDLEVTNRCNLRCPFCVREDEKRTAKERGEKYREGDMETATAMKVLNEVAGKVPSIKFNWRGEPLMNKELPFLIRAAKRRGFIEAGINTNATMLRGPLIEELCDSGLDRLIVSMESFKKESYEKERVGARLENVLANLKTLIEFKRDLGMQRPYVRVQKVDLPWLSHENDEYLDFFEELGADSVAINTYKEKDAGKVDWEPLPCAQPFQRLFVTYDGNILPCCQGNLFSPIGNLEDMTVERAWNSSFMYSLRGFHERNEQGEVRQCRKCEVTRPG